MRIKEDNRNLVLLATVALCCAVVAGTASLIDPTVAPLRTERVADNAATVDPAFVDPASARVVGTPFVPNTNPRER